MNAADRALVYIDESVHPDAVELLRRHHAVALGYGADAVRFQDVSAAVTGFLVRTGKITSGMIEAAPRLRVIARHGVGTDSIDVAAAGQRGVQVLITPEANAVSVAEHTVGLLIAAARHFPACDSAVRSGGFSTRDRLVGTELAGRTLAIAGYGRVGARVARIAEAIGMRVRIHDPRLAAAAGTGSAEAVDTLAALLDRAHALTLHLPLTDESRGIIGPAELDRLAPGALVVNAARGGLVDETALAERLADGRLSGAGIDVFASEPPQDTPLLASSAAQLTPHTAAHTSDALRRMSVHAAQGISAVLENTPLPDSVQPVRVT